MIKITININQLSPLSLADEVCTFVGYFSIFLIILWLKNVHNMIINITTLPYNAHFYFAAFDVSLLCCALMPKLVGA